jgi:hypothetical protein
VSHQWLCSGPPARRPSTTFPVVLVLAEGALEPGHEVGCGERSGAAGDADEGEGGLERHLPGVLLGDEGDEGDGGLARHLPGVLLGDEKDEGGAGG